MTDGPVDVISEISLDRSAIRHRRKRHSSWIRRVTRRPRHWIKEHKALSIIIGIALLLLLILLIWLWILNNKLGQVPRFDADLGDDRPPYLGIGTNVLLVGVDYGQKADLKEMLDSGEWEPGVFRSDTIMLSHLSEDNSSAQVISIPRDSYVEVEGVGTTKINAAFSAGGPSLLGRTVEDITGVFIDHIFVVDFTGFEGVTEAIGGVQVYVPNSITDPRIRKVVWAKGWHTVEGESALKYVRERYGLPRGDFDRVQRQQNLIRAIVDRVSTMAVLANPIALTQLVDSVSEHLAVDSTVDNARLRSLAWDSRNLRPGDISFATAPNSGSATIRGASVVQLLPEEVLELCQAMAHDQFAEYVLGHTVEMLPGELDVD